MGRMEKRVHRGVIALCLLPLAAIAVGLAWGAADHGIVTPLRDRALVERLPELEAAVEARLAAEGWTPTPELSELRRKVVNGRLDEDEIAALRAVVDRPTDPAAVDRRYFLQFAADRLAEAREKGDAAAARSLETVLSEFDSEKEYARFLSETARWRSTRFAADRQERASAAEILERVD